MKELFLDIETSGTDPTKHSIISIGMIVSIDGLEDYQSFYREIKYNELMIMPQSMEVNRIDLTDQTNKIPITQADEEAVSFIRKYFPVNTKLIPIGLNIGSFDMQFIWNNMPLLSEKLGYRSVDLNSLLYVLAEKHSKDFKDLKHEFSNQAHKVAESLGLGVGKHNALYDSLFNLCLYLLIKKDIIG